MQTIKLNFQRAYDLSDLLNALANVYSQSDEIDKLYIRQNGIEIYCGKSVGFVQIDISDEEIKTQ